MPLYRCSIRGENFPGLLLGESGPVGFYATRFVEAFVVARFIEQAPGVINIATSERHKVAKTVKIQDGKKIETAILDFDMQFAHKVCSAEIERSGAQG